MNYKDLAKQMEAAERVVKKKKAGILSESEAAKEFRLITRLDYRYWQIERLVSEK
jgi:hypothetical protein